MNKNAKTMDVLSYDFDSVDVEEIRDDVSEYMDKHAYDMNRSSFGHKFNV